MRVRREEPEHFDPIFFTVGAAFDSDRLVDVHTGFMYGNLSMRAFAFVGL